VSLDWHRLERISGKRLSTAMRVVGSNAVAEQQRGGSKQEEQKTEICFCQRGSPKGVARRRDSLRCADGPCVVQSLLGHRRARERDLGCNGEHKTASGLVQPLSIQVCICLVYRVCNFFSTLLCAVASICRWFCFSCASVLSIQCPTMTEVKKTEPSISDLPAASMLRQGAEAVRSLEVQARFAELLCCPQRVYKIEEQGRQTIVKERFSKKYRHPDLDRKLIKHRMATVSVVCVRRLR
jgi:hypothetical protein